MHKLLISILAVTVITGVGCTTQPQPTAEESHTDQIFEEAPLETHEADETEVSLDDTSEETPAVPSNNPPLKTHVESENEDHETEVTLIKTPEGTTAAPDNNPPLSTSCNSDLSCFIEGMRNGQEAFYTGVRSGLNDLPGVRVESTQSWVFIPFQGTLFRFTSTTTDTSVTFEEGWYRPYMEAGNVPGSEEIVLELNSAVWPTQEELASMDEDMRTAIEQQMQSGISAVDASWQQAEFTTNHFIRQSLIAGNTQVTCSGTERDEFIRAIDELGAGPIFTKKAVPFLECTEESLLF